MTLGSTIIYVLCLLCVIAAATRSNKPPSLTITKKPYMKAKGMKSNFPISTTHTACLLAVKKELSDGPSHILNNSISQKDKDEAIAVAVIVTKGNYVGFESWQLLITDIPEEIPRIEVIQKAKGNKTVNNPTSFLDKKNHNTAGSKVPHGFRQLKKTMCIFRPLRQYCVVQKKERA